MPTIKEVVNYIRNHKSFVCLYGKSISDYKIRKIVGKGKIANLEQLQREIEKLTNKPSLPNVTHSQKKFRKQLLKDKDRNKSLFMISPRSNCKLESEISLLGIREYVSLPNLGIIKAKAKIDTGASVSSIHARNISKFKKQEIDMVKFDVFIPSKGFITSVSKIKGTTKIRSSNGSIELRYKIRTKIKIYNKTYNIDLTLSRKRNRRHPILIGREAIVNKFVVDVSRKYIGGQK